MRKEFVCVGLFAIKTESVWTKRGQCAKCGRKSYRWGKWRDVERWFVKHKCCDERVGGFYDKKS
jgi:hypothetical protein